MSPMNVSYKYSVKRCNNAIAACETLIAASDTVSGKAHWQAHRAKWMERLRAAMKGGE